MEEYLKALDVLLSANGKDDHFHHFSKSFVVLLINQKRIPEAVSYFVETDCAGLKCHQGAA